MMQDGTRPAAWSGSVVDSLSPQLAQRLASVVGPGRPTDDGDALPALWHWAYFSPTEPNDQLGPDGHPVRKDQWARRFPRRMAGGGRVERLAPLLIGRPAEKRSRLEHAEEKSGRSGSFVVCDWRHSYWQGGQKVMDELQTVIYRAAATPPRGSGNHGHQGGGSRSAAPGPSAAIQAGGASWTSVARLRFDPVLLFRFSAATWNSHRIHYDRDYAESEGYRGLLVHGPLLALLLAREAGRAIGDPRLLEFRSHSPVFDDEVLEVFLSPAEGSCRLEARKSDGTVASSLLASVRSQ